MPNNYFQSLTSLDNLELALIRLNTSMNTNYKQFFRPILQMYNINAKENLKNLQNKLRSHCYETYSPVRIYTPKPSGLQRPMTLLCIEDQILLQSVANIYAKNLSPELSKYIGRAIFSNWPQKNDSIFFLQKWQFSYTSYINFIKKKYHEGNQWIVKFDLSSFFDTIDHDLLIKRICNRNGNKIFQEETKKWFRSWSSDNIKSNHSHGIPQGPIASGFLAECFMLPIDKELLKNINYARYVDDIRLMGNNENQVRKELVRLDRLCKDRGLIPNVDKTGIKEYQSVDEVLADLPEIFSYFEFAGIEKFQEKEIIKLIDDAIGIESGNYKIISKSKFRYLLFRAPSSDFLLNLILTIWQKTPEHTDAYIAYLNNNYSSDRRIIDFCKSLLTNNYPYDYVRGELWKLLAKYGGKNDLLPLVELAIKSIKERNLYSAEKIGIYAFLLSCERIGLGKYSNWIMSVDNSIILSQIEPFIDLSTNKFHGVVNTVAKHHLIDAWLGIIPAIRSLPDFFTKYGIQVSIIPEAIKNSLTKIGVINVKTKVNKDYLGTYIHKHFSTILWKGWKKLLGTEYIQCWNLMSESNLYFKCIIRSKTAIDSEPWRPPNPEHVGHQFRAMAATF